ncbi:MAG: RsmD family RNA methyltransferase [Planctomycetota bacterium]
MTLRIAAGRFKGKKLHSLPGLATRPLLGMVRAAIFDILGPGCAEDQEVWDLFAGTGANGLEAYSRGARAVTFVERGPKALKVLRQNLELLGPDLIASSRVLRSDAWRAPPGGERPPKLIFLDPPYPQTKAEPIDSIARAEALRRELAPSGCLMFHFEDGTLDRTDFGERTELRTWGTSTVAFLHAPS